MLNIFFQTRFIFIFFITILFTSCAIAKKDDMIDKMAQKEIKKKSFGTVVNHRNKTYVVIPLQTLPKYEKKYFTYGDQ